MDMKTWLLAARPKTLPAALVPVWAGSVLAWKLTGAWSPGLAACALFSAMAIQIATNFFNDALDFQKGADTEKRLGPVRVTASGLMTPRRVVILGVVALGVACAFGVPLILARGWPILAIGLPSLYFSWGYTGGPHPLAYRGLGELFVLLFFGIIAVAGTVFVNTGQWFWGPSLVLGLQVGSLSTALIAINNLRDIEEDTRTGKRTLAVRFGVGWARAEIALLCCLPWMIGLLTADWTTNKPQGIAMLLGLAFAVVAIVRPITHTPPSPAYNKYLALAGAQLVLFAVIFSL
jgi:1,4-dihydroxy-2-naphthoate octaprenyltransferase